MIRKMTELVRGGSAAVDGASIQMAFVPKNIVRAIIAYFVLSFAVLELAVGQHNHATAPTRPAGLMTGFGNLNHPVSTRNTEAQQFALNYAEPPDWYYPVRESLGPALLLVGDAAGAEKVFREDLKNNPRNGRSLFGLIESLKAQGKQDAARWVEGEFKAAWKKGEVQLRMKDL